MATKPVARRRLAFALKIAVSGGLLAWVLAFAVDWSELPGIMARVDPWLLLLAFAMTGPGLLISASRWQAMLRCQGVHVPLYSLIDSCIIASFYNMLLPTRVGGDVSRALDLRRANRSLAKSAATVVVERLFGISVLFAFAVVAALWRLPLASEVPAVPVAIALGLAGLATIYLGMYLDVIGRLLAFMPHRRLRVSLAEKWGRFHGSAVALMHDRRAVGFGLGYSVLLQVNVVLHGWVLGISLGFDVPLLDYFFLVPLQLIILMLPAINGLGLREVSSVVLFGFYGVAATSAVAFSFIELFFMVLLFAIGWLRLVSRRSLPEATAPPACGQALDAEPSKAD